MIVEFIGSTGAGKTTLISEVQSRLARSAQVTTSFELLATPLRLHGVTHPTAKNFIQELLGLPFFVRSLYRHQAFVSFALQMLARQANFTVFTMNNLRSLERKIGMYEVHRRYGGDRIILVDEGTALSAHNVFVYSSVSYTAEEINKFANLIPLADVLVYIRAPADNLVRRSLQRTDPPREMKARDPALIEAYVNRAVSVFEQLIKAKNVRGRVLIVENPDSNGSSRGMIANDITDFVLNFEPSNSLT